MMVKLMGENHSPRNRRRTAEMISTCYEVCFAWAQNLTDNNHFMASHGKASKDAILSSPEQNIRCCCAAIAKCHKRKILELWKLSGRSVLRCSSRK